MHRRITRDAKFSWIAANRGRWGVSLVEMSDAGRLDMLAVAAGQGDRPALSSLYDAVSPDLLGYLVDMVRNRAVAEDLLSQLWIKAMAGLADRRAPVVPWLFRIARNLAIDHLRSQARSERLMRAGLNGSTGNGASGAASGGEDVRVSTSGDVVDAGDLRTAVGRLPDDQRDVVLLRYYSGMTFAQMAEVLDTPMSTVVFRLRGALKVLRKELAHEVRA